MNGGILGTIPLPPPIADSRGKVRGARVDLVSLVRTGPRDHQKPYRLTIDVIDSDGKKHHVVDDTIVFDDPAEGSGCWISPLTLARIKPGPIAFVVSIDGAGKPVRIPVQVRLQR